MSMRPEELRTAGETIVALRADPQLRDWREGLAQGLGVPRAEIESYASGDRPLPPELGRRIGRLLEELGRNMSTPGRLTGEIQRRNNVSGSDRSDEERQHGPLSPAEAESGVWPSGPTGPKRRN